MSDIKQCPYCEGTSFEIHDDEGLVSFICKHCGTVGGKYISWDPGVGQIKLGDLPGAEDASV